MVKRNINNNERGDMRMYKKLIGAMLAVVVSAAAPMLMAGDNLPLKTVAQVYEQKENLSGKRIRLVGNVVKVNNGIMGKNFLHVQDGSGGPNSNDLTVTSQQTAQKGDKVEIEALVTLNRDFGAGYNYPLILEEAKIKPAK
ncbi:hypothetical protein ACFL2V_13980 [Pseudomonadota bacterium]